jgi:hypothetical protein
MALLYGIVIRHCYTALLYGIVIQHCYTALLYSIVIQHYNNAVNGIVIIWWDSNPQFPYSDRHLLSTGMYLKTLFYIW